MIVFILSQLTTYFKDYFNCRCFLPGWNLNDTYEIQNKEHFKFIKKYIPLKKGETEYDKCHFKKYTNFSSKLESCKKWVYSKQYFNETLINKVIIISIKDFKVILQRK